MKIVRKPPSDTALPKDTPVVVPTPPKQPSERRIDDEAVSRMDDEGGVPDATGIPGEVKKSASGR